MAPVLNGPNDSIIAHPNSTSYVRFRHVLQALFSATQELERTRTRLELEREDRKEMERSYSELKDSYGKIQEELKDKSRDLRDTEEKLEKASEDLKKEKVHVREKARRITYLTPLAGVGKKIRHRFLEQARYKIFVIGERDRPWSEGNSKDFENIIKPGDEAAHWGNLRADLACFCLGWLKPQDRMCRVASDARTWADLYQHLYGMSPDQALAAIEASRVSLCRMSELRATMASFACFVPSSRASKQGVAEFERIERQIHALEKTLFEKTSTDRTATNEQIGVLGMSVDAIVKKAAETAVSDMRRSR